MNGCNIQIKMSKSPGSLSNVRKIMTTVSEQSM